MNIRKLYRRRKQIMRNFIATHDPRFPRPGQYVHFSAETASGAEWGTGTYYPNPARIEQDLSELRFCSSPRVIPWEYIDSWYPYRAEGVKRKKARERLALARGKVKVQA